MKILEKNKMITRSAKETKKIAGKLAESFTGGEIILFRGEVGAGKTVFTQGICEKLGVKDYVNSPSYVLLNTYKSEKFNFYHYDLYRIGSIDELTELGYYEFPGKPENITIIEWSELLECEMPESYIIVEIKVIDSKTREIIITRG
ncbi:MAG: tRNA (adenosine(37)-N6)-threonylcarbamoyltransferase complex ATPase subunit type 1 TsaE [Candidatus Delongbacteria bacterium]|nr:tRNA (adenosine(37)-N6)-threonylcarbamoyltransferase complex ATPase subunit type 1 TsaE [Candidatus Delongbacteria bacterium]MBN2834535.1 tRNA (adenosine(37)-N6)-threonylcarbamoyltransferase complex ATPase subunit type 1 TsaE [Candidatus Delongbacteria bacterium]